MTSYGNEEKNPGITAEVVFSLLILFIYLFFNLAEKVMLMLLMFSNNFKLDGLYAE